MAIETTNKKANLTSNKELEKFSDILEKFIFANKNAAKNHAHGDNGLVVALHGKWGSGKTYFLEYFIKKLKKNTEAVVISYNAWENDYFNDPFVSLVGQISSDFEKFNDVSATEALKNAAASLFECVKTVSALALEAHGHGGIANLLRLIPKAQKIKKVWRKILKKRFSDAISAYEEFTKNQENFKTKLTELGEKNKLKIIIIDELDRCNPLFAIKVLERIKHFFNAENTVFFIATDLNAIAESAKKVYGSSYDAEHYLSRFFNFTFALPKDNSLYKTNLSEKLRQNMQHDSELILEIIDVFGFEIREQNKLINTLIALKNIYSTYEHLPDSTGSLYILAAVKLSSQSRYDKLIRLNTNFTDSPESFHNSMKEFMQLVIPALKAANYSNLNDLKKAHKQLAFALFTLFCLFSCLTQENNTVFLNKFMSKQEMGGMVSSSYIPAYKDFEPVFLKIFYAHNKYSFKRNIQFLIRLVSYFGDIL